ncbi:MAG: hypothetical protein SPF67_02730 [Eubacteriales bacterium]|nr:hypothetical protein [Eubacterium sp.]MDD7179869.1 hypothetical protein [Eubacterium sp.]MDY5493458.1 hypothetical protein [Eubacteriales bacterium]CDE18972.1 unknown [Eubacterium sp. CAG:841]
MKKLTKIVSLALVLVMAVMMLASCGGSKYPAIEKAFVDAGYENNTTFTGVMNTIKEELAKEEYAVELHMLTKKSNGLTSAIVIEFKSTKELVEYYESSATVQGLIKDVSENEDVNKMYNALVNAGYANGNCLVVPASILYINEITNIVKSVK